MAVSYVMQAVIKMRVLDALYSTPPVSLPGLWDTTEKKK